MAENSLISWTDHTFNAFIGCTKVSEACHFCYAERDWDHRFGRVQWGPKGNRVLTSDDNWKKPLAWDRKAAQLGVRYRVFCNSLSDWMDDHPSIHPDWRARQWDLMTRTPNLDWLPLTKRPENWQRFIPDLENPLPNVRLGVSIENNPRMLERLDWLREVSELGWKTFVSYEPACGPVDWELIIHSIGWLIAGGESGPKARPSHPDWFRSARDTCERHGVPFHFKQHGEWAEVERDTPTRVVDWAKQPKPGTFGTIAEPGDRYISKDGHVVASREEAEANVPYRLVRRVGLKRSGRRLDGVEHNAFPRAA